MNGKRRVKVRAQFAQVAVVLAVGNENSFLMLWVSFLKQAVAADDVIMVKKLLQKEVRPQHLPDKFLTEIFYDPSVKEVKPYMINAFSEFLDLWRSWTDGSESPCVLFLRRIEETKTKTLAQGYLYAHTSPLASVNIVTCASFFDPDFLRRLKGMFDMGIALDVLKKLKELGSVPVGTTRRVLDALYENINEKERSAFFEEVRKLTLRTVQEWIANNQQVDVFDECISELKELDKKRAIVLEKIQGELKKQKK